MPRRSVGYTLLVALFLGCLYGCGGGPEEGIKQTEQLPPGRVPQMKKNGAPPSSKPRQSPMRKPGTQ
jgi:hypothetical protein